MGLCVKFLVLSLSVCIVSCLKICLALCLTRLTPPSCGHVLSLSSSWLPEEIVFLSFRKTTVIKYMVGAWGTQIVDTSKKKKKKQLSILHLVTLLWQLLVGTEPFSRNIKKWSK